MYSEIKHIFFDLDDTLWDFEKNSSYILKQLYAEYSLNEKLKVSYDEFYKYYKQLNLDFWSRYNKGIIDKQYLRNNRFHEAFKNFNYDNYNENLLITEQYISRAPHGKHLKEGCIEVLNYLQKNYQLHIITNGFKEIQHIKIDNCGLRNYFQNIIISEEHQVNKPNKKIFELSEKQAGALPKESVMIGDNYESDIEGAINAGWKAIHMNHSLPQIHHQQINSLQELKQLF